MPSFSVACLAREEAEVIGRFVSHHLMLGAEQVNVYFDGEPPSAVRALFDREKAASLTVCDDAFWHAHAPVRPDDPLEDRQRAVYRHAQGRCTTTWLLLTDADELLAPQADMDDILAAVPPTVDSLGMPAVEAVWGPGDDPDKPFGSTWFRKPFERARLWQLAAPLIYGREAGCFTRNMLGHSDGKNLIRTAARFDRLDLHFSLREGRKVTVPITALAEGRFQCATAHFDAISYPRWRDKFRRRISGTTTVNEMRPARREQMRRINAALTSPEGEQAARRLFHRFYCLSHLQLAVLTTAGAAHRQPLFTR